MIKVTPDGKGLEIDGKTFVLQVSQGSAVNYPIIGVLGNFDASEGPYFIAIGVDEGVPIND